MASVRENVAEAATPEQRARLVSVLKSGSVKVRCSVAVNPYKSATYGNPRIGTRSKVRHGFGQEKTGKHPQKKTLTFLQLTREFQ